MILRLLSFILVLALPVSSWAAITYIGKTDSTDTKNVSSVTTSVTVAAGTDRALVFCSQARNAGSSLFSLSSVVRNGQSFTFVRKDIKTATDGPIQTEAWVLAAPTTGAANVVAAYGGANSQVLGNTITEWNGVSQASPVDSHAGANGTGTAIAATITTVADNAAIVDCVHGRPDAGVTVGAGQTMRTDRLIGNIPTPLVNDGAGVSTVVTKTPAGAEVMDWTQAEAFQWAISAVSLTPSGGSDPAPVVPGQVSLAWTNNTDPGSPSTGVQSTTILRCAGSGCNATIAPLIATLAAPINSYVDGTVQVGNTYGYSAYHTDGAVLTSTRHASVYVTTTGTPPATPPAIVDLVSDLTGANVTVGAVLPTKVKVVTFTNAQGAVSSVEYPLSALTLVSGSVYRFTETWRAGLDGNCFSAIDASGIENPADTARQCDNLQAIGVGPIDTTPPTLTCASPINIPAGNTSWAFSCTVNKPFTTASWDTTDVAYASMTNAMTLNGLTFSGVKTGLTNGSASTVYVRAQLTGLIDGEDFPALTSTPVVINVAASAGDVTPPGDVAGLVSTLIGNSVQFTWTHPATDAVNYQLYQSNGACTDYSPSGQATAPPMTVSSLAFSTVYCWKMKALDVVNNLSTNFSGVVTKTTLAAPDIERPSDLGTITAEPYTSTVRLAWPLGTDNSNFITTNIEFCQAEVGQEDCSNFISLVSNHGQTFLTPANLTPGRRYCYKGKNEDGSGNVSLNYSPIVCATTPTSGLSQPKLTEQFGSTRAAGVRSSGTKLTRP